MLEHCWSRCLLVCFPCRYLTLAPETAEETYVEISDTEPEDPVGASSTTYLGKRETDITLYSFQPTCLVVSWNVALILSTLLMPPSNPNSHDPHIPAKHCIAMLPLAQPLVSMIRKLASYRMLWFGYHFNKEVG